MGNILYFETLDSTQSYLKEHFTQLDDQTVVIAGEQTAGRGRFDRKWISQPGGLYFSVLLKPTCTSFLSNITQLMALSVCQAAEKHGIAPNVKWPNDVQVNGKKLCGILSEAVALGDKIACLIVGVGINVAQKDLSHVGQPAVSLRELGVPLATQDFLHEVLALFFQSYLNVIENGFAAIRTAYMERFPFVGKQISIKNGTGAITGIVEDLSPRGTLLLKTQSGTREILIGDLLV
jgi:BirA family biotin operon repressor/biotin-[acetyl-CoA-carboxylase] ligase